MKRLRAGFGSAWLGNPGDPEGIWPVSGGKPGIRSEGVPRRSKGETHSHSRERGERPKAKGGGRLTKRASDVGRVETENAGLRLVEGGNGQSLE